jgi:hypothetical protein
MPTNTNSSIQSANMPIQLSFDNQVTWKDLVCLTDYQLPLNSPLTATDSFCGKKVGVGNIEFNPSGTAVCEVIPDASEVSAPELLDVQNAKSSIYFRVQNPQSGSVGLLLYIAGSCKVTNVTIIGQANNLITFTFQLTGEGVIVLTKP